MKGQEEEQRLLERIYAPESLCLSISESQFIVLFHK